VGLDTSLTDELVEEGLFREMVRTVQDARKHAGLDVADRIVLKIAGDSRVERALETHREYLMNETLALRWDTPTGPRVYRVEHAEGESHWEISFAKA
jgi:isoleucyl-tRNA synthetase